MVNSFSLRVQMRQPSIQVTMYKSNPLYYEVEVRSSTQGLDSHHTASYKGPHR